MLKKIILPLSLASIVTISPIANAESNVNKVRSEILDLDFISEEAQETSNKIKKILINRDVNLTKEQKNKIRDLEAESNAMLKEQEKQLLNDLNVILSNSNFDENKASKIINKKAELEHIYGINQVRLYHAIYQILTPQQRKQVTKIANYSYSRSKSKN